MILYNVEYITKDKVVYNCKILCIDRNCLQDEIKDISNIVGGLNVLSVHEINNNVHRISKTIRKKIVLQSTGVNYAKKKIGRPRKYIL